MMQAVRPTRTVTARLLFLLGCAALASSLSLRGAVLDGVDLDAIYQIKAEGLERSQVMDVARSLTDVHGPRLTGSPNIKAAAEYAVAKMREWGLSNVRLETWGPFGRGWTNDYVLARAVSPQAYPFIAYPKAWTLGTNGSVTAEAVIAIIDNDAQLQSHRGTLKGKFVLTAQPRELRMNLEPLGRRLTDQQLAELERQPMPRPRTPGGNPQQQQTNFARRRMKFFEDEGVIALLEPGRGEGGTVFVQAGGSRNVKDPPAMLQMVVAAEHYGRIFRTLQQKIPVTLELDVRNRFHDQDLNSFNVLADVPGTDKADELVMMGAHFDSWHTGTGATDNAAGSAIVMEAIRILKATGLKPRRTIRVALWTGEEQGLLGSRAYVKEHFGDRATMTLKPEHTRVSGYFNVDNGTGAIRGVFLQNNESIKPIFSEWMQPLRSLGMTTLAIRGTGGTDHLSFDEVGLPGFQFIQDPIEYETRTHHSNMDVYERLQPADMMQNAVIVASFAYHTSTRNELLPRKPLPKPQPQPKQQSAGGQ